MGREQFLRARKKDFYRKARVKRKMGSNESIPKAPKPLESQEKCKALECPKHGIPYQVEYSKDPQIGGAWKHYFCLKCRG